MSRSVSRVSTQGVDGSPARGRRRLLHGLDRLAATFARRVAPAPLSVAIESAAGQLRSADDLRVFSDFHFWLAAGSFRPPGTGVRPLVRRAGG